MRSPIENVTEHPAEKDKKGGSAGGDAPVCRMKAAVRKNTQYFRKNSQYFRKNSQYFRKIYRYFRKNSQYFRKIYRYFRKNCWYFRKKHARTAIKLTAEN